MVCPIEIYISAASSTSETTSRLTSAGVSRSLRASSLSAEALFAAPGVFEAAPYPAFSTAAIMLASDALPSTPISPVSRLTEQEVTPSTPDTAFSTRELQAAQLIPVTLNCFILPPVPRRRAVSAERKTFSGRLRTHSEQLPTRKVGFILPHNGVFVNSFFTKNTAPCVGGTLSGFSRVSFRLRGAVKKRQYYFQRLTNFLITAAATSSITTGNAALVFAEAHPPHPPSSASLPGCGSDGV